MLLALIVAASLLSPVPAQSATDGLLGTTSRGSVSISLQIQQRIRITNVQDMTLPSFTGTGDSVSSENVCIYTNARGGRYRVTATGDGGGGAFTVRKAGGNEIPYQARWNHLPQPGGVLLTAGTALPGQTGANRQSETCGGSPNANLGISILSPVLAAHPAGTYTGTLRLLVEPE